jgi:acyl carrier protein
MVLSRHPAVRGVAVLAGADLSGDKRLVAYVVLAGNAAEAIGQLRGFAKEHLPDYMVPATFVAMDLLPLTSNGKLDRQALPALSVAETGREVSFVAPRTPVEELLATIWAEVLQVDRVGVEDNFFALGGHSLRAIQVMARLRDKLGIELGVRELFETPTVSGLAVRVERIPAPGRSS